MKARVLTLQLDPETGVFDDTPLVDLLAQTDALTVTDHLVMHDGEPKLVLVVRFRAVAAPGAPRPERAADPALDLSEPDRALFETLRRWRNDRARSEGRPAYVLFKNAQLVAIATARPSTLAALQGVEGVGQARARDYGQDVLAIVQSTPAGATSEAPPDEQPPDPSEP